MSSQPSQQATAERVVRMPVGTINRRPAELAVHYLKHNEGAGSSRGARPHFEFAETGVGRGLVAVERIVERPSGLRRAKRKESNGNHNA